MAKYLLLWELDSTKVPFNPQERKVAWKPLTDMVKQDIQKGLIKNWGCFVGEFSGYSVLEGTEIEIGNMIQRYVPYVNFKVHPIASVEQIEYFILTEKFTSNLNFSKTFGSYGI